MLDFAIALFTGCLAILLGLLPLGGLLDVFDHFKDELDRLCDSLSGVRLRPARPLMSSNRGKPIEGQIWFAAGGAVLILITFLAYLVE